jgi:hypothetical protein
MAGLQELMTGGITPAAIREIAARHGAIRFAFSGHSPAGTIG